MPAVAAASEPCTALASIEAAKSLRIVPGAALAGFGGAHEVAPPAMALSASSTMGCTAPAS
jgi:hypothetical protein